MRIIPDGSVTSPAGYVTGSTAAGIKKQGLDLCILASERPAFAAGAFTTNKVKAAPVYVCQRNLADGMARAVVINSGNANACTHDRGIDDALEMASLTAAKLGIPSEQVLVSSTGVIGVYLPMDNVRAGIGTITLSPTEGLTAAQAIMTTDTTRKTSAVSIDIAGKIVTIGGMAKGAGMIHPNMATLLSYVTTDAAVESAGVLKGFLSEGVDTSFNMITVDGDTSTNDTLLLFANGAAGNAPIRAASPEAAAFQSALNYVLAELAKAIARDGEGATKLIQVDVRGATNRSDARKVARTVAGSSLVKSAVYGADPNWGRILCAAGYSGAEVDQEKADIQIGVVPLMLAGDIQPLDRKLASAQLAGPEVSILVDLHLGTGEATAWGCDLTEQYVDINAKYTT